MTDADNGLKLIHRSLVFYTYISSKIPFTRDIVTFWYRGGLFGKPPEQTNAFTCFDTRLRCLGTRAHDITQLGSNDLHTKSWSKVIKTLEKNVNSDRGGVVRKV